MVYYEELGVAFLNTTVFFLIVDWNQNVWFQPPWSFMLCSEHGPWTSACLCSPLGQCAQPISYLPYALWPHGYQSLYPVCPPLGVPSPLQNPCRRHRNSPRGDWVRKRSSAFSYAQVGRQLYSYSTKYHYGRKSLTAGFYI